MIELKSVSAGYGGQNVIFDITCRFETGVN